MDALKLDEMIKQFITEEKVKVLDDIGRLTYEKHEERLRITFKLVNGADYYEYDDEHHVWKDKADDEAYMREPVKNGEDMCRNDWDWKQSLEVLARKLTFLPNRLFFG